MTRTKTFLVLVCATLTSMVSMAWAVKKEAMEKSLSAAEIFEQLKKDKGFVIGRIGENGAEAHTNAWIKTLAEQQNARIWFLRLVYEGELGGKLYGLYGLGEIKTDPAEIRQLAQPLLLKNPKVETMAGCLIMDRPAAQIARSFWDEKTLAKQKPTIEAQKAYDVLKDSKEVVFTTDGTWALDGGNRKPSPQIQQLLILQGQSDARVWMFKLLQEKNDVTKVYALYGLRKLGVPSSELMIHSQDLRQRNPNVRTLDENSKQISQPIGTLLSTFIPMTP